ncbi:APN2 DNA lyase apurinic/apyrimidinic [Viridothelium virens]|uniref:DNA-(apurinic or apyrimidinic site) endonuclease 2 n=1 Tax=Viridothelium virens TaxID=1048519 RepID=A0A6A6GW66_VIRVR|nr:APN2 DNA lyase apurinic/apyrimidinic [Viridothelium virens]
MRITTWNVNGIRNPFGYQPWRDQRTFNGMFDILEADIVVMQELKIQRKDLTDDMVLVPGWDCYYSLPKHKKGYSGVAIYTRQSVCAPIRAEEGLIGVLCPPNSSCQYRELPEEQQIGGYLTEKQISGLIPASIMDDSKKIDAGALDAEGRCVILEFPAFVLFGVYSPANSNGMREDFRYAFLTALDTRIRNLHAMGKRVILTGDLNVSRSEIETANAEEDMRKSNISHEDYISTPNRRVFNQLVEGGPVAGDRDPGREKPILWDICREFHPNRKGMYTHWEQKINARPGNYGSRIDYILCSIGMKTWFREANIQEGLMGSDHCPVYAVFKDIVEDSSELVSLLDMMNPPGMFKGGARQWDYNTKEIPAFSCRLLPEFKKRRNIKDMFSRKPSLAKVESAAESGDDASKTLPQSLMEPSSNVSTQSSFAAQNESQKTASLTSSPERTEKQPRTDKKRQASSSSPLQTVKRSKSKTTSTPPTPPVKGQQSLRGFFKPKTAAKPTESSHVQTKASTHIHIASGDEQPSDQGVTTEKPGNSDLTKECDDPESPTIFDPIVSKESWDRLFAKPAAPRCESHHEPCMRLQSKKKGFNLGREFWMCARPISPSGNKERGTQWRCTTFIWASDWQGANDGSRIERVEAWDWTRDGVRNGAESRP